MLEKFKRDDLKKKGITASDRKYFRKELEKLKIDILKRGGRLPGNEKENIAGGEKLLKEAIEHKEQQKKEREKEVEAWAKDEATFVSKKMKNAVSVIGGLGSGRDNICSFCRQKKNHTVGEWNQEEKRVLYKCDSCREKEYKPRPSYMKIIVH